MDRNLVRVLWLLGGVLIGGGLVWLQSPPVRAHNDRFEDYVMCTGPVSVMPRALTDGVWLLDYKTGKLLGTVIDRTQGKIVGWAEVDLVTEFNLAPKQDVHFLMTTGSISQGQSALYLAETTTSKFGVYTMSPAPSGQGFTITRHDQVAFRPDDKKKQ